VEVWVYVDESQAPSAKAVDAGRPFRIGALLVEQRIPGSLITGALDALSRDPDACGNSADAETLARGYFHASFDSPNAHSHLSRAISEACIIGQFHDFQWRFDQPGGDEYGESELHALANVLGVLHVLQDDYDAVHLVVASREGSFGASQASDWEADLYTKLLGSAADQPNIPMRFPRVTLTLVGGKEPGIQVCDILLWAVQRARFDALDAKGKREWVDRLGLRMDSATAEQTGPQATAQGVLGNFEERTFLPNLFQARPRTLEEMGTEQVGVLLRKIERDIHACEARASAGNPRIGHLQGRLASALERVSAEKASPNSLVELARAFLLVCDTLPVYDPANPKECERAWEKRRVASAVCNQTDIRWVAMTRYWRGLMVGGGGPG
jgi:hypothetical protein